ncbi:hypothetical protein [Caldalkalibacillus salinus]|uniref:hypothetical protein n=1 Tax=Caldalkalibacillus salinus TaxID=2803787 RepID=UPI0019242019|nr:hypothetical protein [Caldalkalibacillus salinus]
MRHKPNSFKTQSNGGIVLEASIILPFFLCFMLFLITLIRIALIDITLHHGVNEATKQLASQMYLADKTYQAFSESEYGTDLEENVDKIKADMNPLKDLSADQKQELELYSEMALQTLRTNQGWRDLEDQFYHSMVGRYFRPLVDRHVHHAWINIEHVMVTDVQLPNLKTKEHPYVSLEVRYDMQLPVPFFYKTVHFQHRAYERAWVGDHYLDQNGRRTGDEDNREEEEKSENGDGDHDGQDDKEENRENEEDDEEDNLIIHSVTSPVQRGRGVTIIAEGPPNQTANIRLYYQSGFQKEVSCTSNANGWFKCDIRIGGNSNEGSYTARMTVDELEDEGSFQVLSKANMEEYIRDREGQVNGH